MSEARQNSVRQLSELYNVIIGIALSISIYNSIDTSSNPIPIKLDRIVNLATFLVIIIPFYHGAVRHLFATYVEGGGSSRIRNGTLLVDFILLFLEGCLFILMASILGETVKFAWALVAILVLDSVWGFLTYLTGAGAQAQSAERKWAKLNILTAGVISLALIFGNHVFEDNLKLGQGALFIIIALRTIFDYVQCWSFYFPAHDPKG